MLLARATLKICGTFIFGYGSVTLYSNYYCHCHLQSHCDMFQKLFSVCLNELDGSIRDVEVFQNMSVLLEAMILCLCVCVVNATMWGPNDPIAVA